MMILSAIVSFFLILSDLSATVTSLNDEGLALLSFKQSVSADPTKALDDWNSWDSTPCFWTGIACGNSSAHVVYLSLQNRNLIGSIPPQLGNLSALRHLNLRNNNLSGELPPELFHVNGLQSLVLSGNSLSGTVPPGIGSLGSMKTLSLSNNRFSGSIPSELGNLSSLQGTLDLSHNLFDGTIPTELGNLPDKLYIDFSYNNLSGQIPAVGPFNNLGPTEFEGNPLLCGLPLETLCHTNGSRPVPNFPSQQSGDQSINGHGFDKGILILILIVAGSTIGSGFIGWGVSYLCKKKPEAPATARSRMKIRKEFIFCLRDDIVNLPPEKMDQYNFVSLDRPSTFDLEKLLRGSAFLLGKSGIGMVYRVVLENGQSLAVRRIGEGGTQRLRDFQTEVEAIAKIKHPNVVPLRAYCWSEDEKLLIYDFIPNRDLATAIHGNPPILFSLQAS
ncbi:hypothetical protein SAY87_000116 [Trapa incisa]|uniref:Protein kinase domain-containing protein n=1 Tax=Trapa incisa TaxID=236973 RepID=A0AAN7GB77_9MYRT|nr:hypothetical protein SAY87_000116 [Trapa incisa]